MMLESTARFLKLELHILEYFLVNQSNGPIREVIRIGVFT